MGRCTLCRQSYSENKNKAALATSMQVKLKGNRREEKARRRLTAAGNTQHLANTQITTSQVVDVL